VIKRCEPSWGAADCSQQGAPSSPPVSLGNQTHKELQKANSWLYRLKILNLNIWNLNCGMLTTPVENSAPDLTW
jgi:hypothetical protein